MTALPVHHIKTPVVIIGTGIAGLLTALKLAESNIDCYLVSKTGLSINSSRMAQGGIAAVLPGNPDDSLMLHLKDTIEAAAGLCDRAVAKSILSEGADAIADLLRAGVPFDKESNPEKKVASSDTSQLALGLEAAHSTRRILHAGGDTTGKTVQDVLSQRDHESPNITVLEECFARQLITEETPAGKRCIGLLAIRRPKNKKAAGTAANTKGPLEWLAIEARHVVMATGGIGHLFSHTTNPVVSTGDGAALAYKAGAVIQDAEFIQFHPTGFWAKNNVQFLISEALRGEGGILRNAEGEAFAKQANPQGELAPRDVVARMIWGEIQKQKIPHVYLDMTHLPSFMLENRFPSILKNCASYGIDIRQDWIPVAPAAHYWMGGIQTDAHGQSSLNGLYAVGETTSTGLHGANRLASNSLLECLVLARRVAQRIRTQEAQPAQATKESTASFTLALNQHERLLNRRLMKNTSALKLPIQQLREIMWRHVGIVRNKESLETALSVVKQLTLYGEQEGFFESFSDGFEYENMLISATLVIQCALAREESRGAHYRSDFPDTHKQAVHSHCQIDTDKKRLHQQSTPSL